MGSATVFYVGIASRPDVERVQSRASDLVRMFTILMDMGSNPALQALTWAHFAIASPRLAAAVRRLFEHVRAGLRLPRHGPRDGGPRVHPVSPVIADGGLYCFVDRLAETRGPGARRPIRAALVPAGSSDDEAYLAGRARPVTDDGATRPAGAEMRAAPRVDWRLFEFEIEVAMLTHRDRRRAAGRRSTGSGATAR